MLSRLLELRVVRRQSAQFSVSETTTTTVELAQDVQEQRLAIETRRSWRMVWGTRG